MTRVEAGVPGLTRADRARFRHDGYLVVDRPLVSPDELLVVRDLIESLFAQFDELPRKWAYDLGDVKVHDGEQQIAEINEPTRFDQRLKDTVAFARCEELARQLLGAPVRSVFDHAIYKAPHNGAATEWHQDLASSPHLAGLDSAHIWLALQDVTEANGCMQFIPSDGSQELLPHRKRADEAHANVAEGVDPGAAVACPLEAGMATVHNLTTLHYTGPNNSDEPRLAWIIHFHARPLRMRLRAALRRRLRRLHRRASS